jgi:hypothetical protein
MLSNTPFGNSSQTYANGLSAQELPAGNNYNKGGQPVDITLVTNGSNAMVVGANVTFISTGTMGPFKYIALYGGTGNGAVCWFDFGQQITLGSGDTLTHVWNGSGIMQIGQ